MLILNLTTASAQYFPKSFNEISVNGGFGSKIAQSNIYYGCNQSLYHRSRFYFTSGIRLSTTHNIRQFSFSSPQTNTPILSFNDEGVWVHSLNLALGFTCAISEYLYVGINAELLGLSKMSEMTGTIVGKTDSAGFENTATSTNIIVNPSHMGNLQNQLFMGARLQENLFLNVTFTHQHSQVDILSSLTDYGTFSLNDNAFMMMVGLQWRFDKKQKAH